MLQRTTPGALQAWPPGFRVLIAAQFLSALADNALLIIAIAKLQAQGWPMWWAPLLKLAFNVFYVLLAPGVGALADAVPKARLMAVMNGVKMVGAGLMMAPWHPAWGFALVGLGAAAYAPAKYGIVTELLPPARLVAANGWIEVSVVLAALAGIALGGGLVGPDFAAWSQANGLGGGDPLVTAVQATLCLYGAAAVLQLGLPDTGARYVRTTPHLPALWRDFLAGHRALWADRDGGRLSLTVTTLFWGVGATLQIAVLRWAGEALGLGLDQGAYLQAAVALGVVSGAALAGRCVPLAQARRVLPAGVLLGVLIATVALCRQWTLAVPLLLLAGAVGGVLVVPMNALLQHRGHRLLTAGRSIAVQGFNENLSVLLMLGLYAASWQLPVSAAELLCGFGVLVAAAMLALCWRERSALLRR